MAAFNILTRSGKHRSGDATTDAIRAEVLAQELDILREKYVATLRRSEDLAREIQVLHAAERVTTKRWQQLKVQIQAEREESSRLRATCQRLASSGSEVTQELQIVRAEPRSVDLGQALLDRIGAKPPRQEVVTRVRPQPPVRRDLMVSQLLQGARSIPVSRP